MSLVIGCDRLANRITEYLPPIPDISLSPGDRPQPAQPAQSPTTAEIETLIHQQINDIRQKNGLKTLQNNEKLAEVARLYSQEMAKHNFFSHTGIDGKTAKDRVSQAGITYWVVGENLFKGTNIEQPAPTAVKGWMESPGHRENILRSVFIETGIGVWLDQGKNTYYITQLFLKP